MTFSVTIDRSSLGLAPLVIGDTESAAPYILTRGGLVLPPRRARITYAPASSDMHGQVALAAVYDQSFITMALRVLASTSAELAAAADALVAAIGQFSYTIETAIPGDTTAWAADLGSIDPQPLKLGEAERNMARYTATIPVYPIGVPA